MFLSVEVAGLKEQRDLGQARSVRSGSIFPVLLCRQSCYGQSRHQPLDPWRSWFPCSCVYVDSNMFLLLLTLWHTLCPANHGLIRLRSLAAEVIGLRYQIKCFNTEQERGGKSAPDLAAASAQAHQVRPLGPQESARRIREAIEGDVVTTISEADRLISRVIEADVPADAELPTALPLPAAAPVMKEAAATTSLRAFGEPVVSQKGGSPSMTAAVQDTIDASVAARSAAARARSPRSDCKSPTKAPSMAVVVQAAAEISSAAPSVAAQLLAEAMGDFSPASTMGDMDVKVTEADARTAPATAASTAVVALAFATDAVSQPPTPAKPAEPSDPKFGAIWRSL